MSVIASQHNRSGSHRCLNARRSVLSRRVLSLTVTGLLTAGFSLTAQADSAGHPSPVFRLTFPPQVGAYKAVDHKKYDKVEAGESSRYSDGGPLSIDVYIYPIMFFKGIAPGDTVPAPRALARELDGFKVVLDSGKARGWWTGYHIAYEEDASVVITNDTIPGNLIMTILATADEYQASAFYIYVVHNQFVSMRMTEPSDKFAGGAEMTAFAERMVAALAIEH